jgi:hypothetical protein
MPDIPIARTTTLPWMANPCVGSDDLPPPFVPLFKLELSSFLDCTWSAVLIASL